MSASAAEVLARAGLTRADVYDAFLLREDQSTAILNFVARHALPGARWLDAGCGTGRLLSGLRARGLEVEGLDLDSDYLARARQRAPVVPLHLAGIATAEFERPFDGVLLANGPLAYVLEPGAFARTLRALYRHLGEGGVLIADTPDFPWILEHYVEPTPERASVGNTQVERCPRHTIQGDRFEHEDTVVLRRGGVELGRYREAYPFAIRVGSELVSALKLAGFKNIQRWKSWSATEPDPAAPGPRILLTASR